MTPKNGTDTSYWWFDVAKAEALDEKRRAASQISANGNGETPGVAVSLFAGAMVLFAGWVVFRHVMRRRDA